MFSDHERETLVELETRLLADDPTWAMAFDAASRRVSRQQAFELAFHVVAMTVCVALTGLMLAVHAPGPALFFAAVAATLLWLIRRLRRLRRTGEDRSSRSGSGSGSSSPGA